jgi:inhibitor of KinA
LTFHRCSPLGDSAVRISFGNTISEQVNREIRSFCELLKSYPPKAMIEWTPSYTAVTVYYQPVKTTYYELVTQLNGLLQKLGETTVPKPRRVYVPVCYGGEFGPDLEQVACHNHLSVDEVVRIHSSSSYLIYMLGFTPGFPYMGGMSKIISTPRLKVPRASVPAGSVGIAGEQTGIYSLTTPGGWQIIGRTPLVLYDGNREKPSLFEAGDYVQFYPIEKYEYEEIYKLIEQQSYQLQFELVEEV